MLDTRWPAPPTFLLPWAAGLTTVSHTTVAGDMPPPPSLKTESAGNTTASEAPAPKVRKTSPPHSNESKAAPPLALGSSPSSTTSPLDLSPSIREMLPLLQAQAPHYVTAHIHAKPYLLTQGDTLRLPFLMHGVEPGDILRLNRATNIGSRDYTLKAAAAAPKLIPSTLPRNVLGATTGQLPSHSDVMPTPSPVSPTLTGKDVTRAPHFIPHIEKGKHSYLDERLFVCRAVVMGVESEPMRIKEKTKRRQRRVKTVKSKLKFTVLRVKEVRVRGVEDIEEEV